MHLTNVADKTSFSLLMVDIISQQHIREASLWYHSIGLMNAYYAICEELKKNVANNKDPILSPIVKKWSTEKQEEINSFFGNGRNIATHRGNIKTQSYTTWVVDHHHDTEFPVQVSRVTVSNSEEINNITSDDFLAIAKRAFTYLQNSLLDIEREYLCQGGEEDLFAREQMYFDRETFSWTPNF